MVRRSSRPDSRSRGRSWRPVGTLALAVALTASGTTATAPTAAAAADDSIIFGASGGYEIRKLERNIGAPLAVHRYAKLSGTVKSGRMINIRPTVRWRRVAGARWGSATHQDIRRWADALKQRNERVLVAFSHEPEGKSSDWMGTNKEFKAAWRKVHSVFERRGARNVEFTWTITSNAFRVKPGDDRYYTKWYPGDRYVDNISTAAYNYHDCGPGRGKWLSLENRASAPLRFAKSRNKPYVLAEWASDASPRRAAWLRAARAWLLENRRAIRAAFYYQTPRQRRGCRHKLTTREEFRVFGSMARDRANFTP